MIYTRAFAVWILLMLTETVHGTLRILLLAPITGDSRARQIAVFTGALLIFAVTGLLIKWIKPRYTRQCLLIGAIWVALTVCFEIGLGIMVFDMSLARLAEDYNLLQGGLMPIGLLLMLITPLLAAKMRKIV